MTRQKYHLPLNITYTQSDGTNNTFARGKEIGRGSFSVVYRAVHQGTNQMYAMKVINKKKCFKSKTAFENIRNEIKIQKTVNHPNVVTSQFSFSDEHNYYLILEYCPGKNVRDFLNRSDKLRVKEYEARKILKDVINGLFYIHSNGITHYDIKLENFVIDSNGNVKIGDFGLSTFRKNEEGKYFDIFGTLNYLSPEMLSKSKREESYKVDIWAIGVSAFYLLTGEGPFEGNTREMTFRNIRFGDFHFPKNLTISNEAKDFINVTLQADPRKRPTAKELLNHPFLTRIDKETAILYRPKNLPPLKMPPKIDSEKVQIDSNLNKEKQTNEKLKPNCGPQINNNKIISSKQINNNVKPVCCPPQNTKKIISPRPTTVKFKQVICPDQNDNKLITTRQSNNKLKPICCQPQNAKKIISPRQSNNKLKPVCCPVRNDIRPISPRIGILDKACISPRNDVNIQMIGKNFNIPNHFISRYCFYKDDLGYLLGDGTVGVCFKDNSRIVMDPNEQFVQFYKSPNTNFPDIIQLYKINEENEPENISLVKKVAKNFKKIRFSYDLPDDYYEPGVLLHNITCFVKNDDSILFKLDDTNLQVNFNDRMKLIIFWNTKKMCFFKSIKEKCNLLDVKSVAALNSNSEELKKFKNAKILLSNIALTIC